MDFELSSEQVALREAAGRVLDDLASGDRVRECVGPADSAPADGGFDRRLWLAMAEQGWLAIEQPEDDGGLGLGMVEVAILCEQLGRRVAPVPFTGTTLAQSAFRAAAADESLSPATRVESKTRVDRLTTGEVVGCLAWSASPAATIASAGDDCLLTLCPEPTVYASVADVAVVVTGDAVYEVPLGPDARPAPEPAMDRTRTLAWLPLEGAPAHRIGDAAAARRMLDRAATALAAEMLGASSRVLEMSVEYATERVQFGKPIGSFQAVKHRLADALVDVEGMRSGVFYAAWCIASGHPGASLAASAAKAWCSDASRRVMASGLQVHGGVGFTWEHDLHLYVKRSQLDQVSWGDADFHRERIAAMLSDQRGTDHDLF
ncbi:MAG TPA: acyl-CoA dehydrogenase family protein [Acidimicrobiales bacterium]|nr:acyl-CoA dehydrogenase family protein [Acidimicrobiales bacterium]